MIRALVIALSGAFLLGFGGAAIWSHPSMTLGLAFIAPGVALAMVGYRMLHS
jgi:hypothetical protein